MIVPDADFVRPSNHEGTQQNLIDSGLEVFWLWLGGTSIALSSLETCSAASCRRDGMPSQTTASERINSERASGATAPTRAIEPRSLAGAPAPWCRLFAGVPAAVGSRL